jgi:hypothetical protein
LPVDVLSPDHLDTAFEQMLRERGDFALILPDVIFVTMRQRSPLCGLQIKMATMFGKSSWCRLMMVKVAPKVF